MQWYWHVYKNKNSDNKYLAHYYEILLNLQQTAAFTFKHINAVTNNYSDKI